MIPVHTDDPLVQPGTIVAVALMIVLAVIAVVGCVLALVLS